MCSTIICNIIYYIFVCIYICVSWNTCRGQRTTCRTLFLLPCECQGWVSGMNVRDGCQGWPSYLVAGAFTC